MTDTMSPAEIAAFDAELRFDSLVSAIIRRGGEGTTEEAATAAARVVAEYAAHAEHEARATAAAVEATTSEIPFRSVTRDVDVYANCHGVNHSDQGEIVTHDRCGEQVVRREDGRIFDVIRVGTYQARKFQCWRGQHACHADRIAAVAELRVVAAESGEAVKGSEVVVVRGRKVPKGTTGRVFWTGEDSYGTAKIGIVTADGVKHFTAAKNCDRV